MNNIHESIEQYADDLVHEILLPDQEQEVLEHCEQCSACRRELDKARERLIAFREVELDAVSNDLIQKSLDQIEAPEPKPKEKFGIKSVGRTERFLWLSLAGAAMILIGLNIYWRLATPPSLDMMVYGQSGLYSDSNGSIRVVLFDQDADAPVAGRQVHVDLIDAETPQTVRLASFETNLHGTGTPQFRLPNWANGDYELKVSLDGSSDDVVTRRVNLKRSWHLMLSSDKPVYQPGQTIHLKCLARQRSNSKPVGGKAVSFRILDPKGNLIADENSVSSDYGICAMDLPLADEVIEGAWRVECEIDSVVSSLVVNVQRYVLPKFSVAVKFDQPWFEPDQLVKGSVESQYFFGQPVSGGKATIVFNPSVPGASPLGLATVQLDSDGKGEFEFPVPRQIVGTSRNSGDAQLDLVVRVQDSAGQVEEKTVSSMVTSAPLRIELVPESRMLVAGVPNRVFVFTSYADGRPARANVSISAIPNSIETSDYGVTSFTVTPRKDDIAAGNVSVSASDAEGRIANREFDFAASNADSDFVLRTHKAVYKGGESISVSCFGVGRYPVMLDVIRDQQTLLTESVEVKDGVGELTFDLPADIEGALQINAYRIGGSGLVMRKTRTVFVTPTTELNLEVVGTDQVRRPGENANLKFRLTDAEGKPTPGAVGISIVDSAVSAVASQRLGLLTSLSEGDAELLEPLFTIYPWFPRFNGDAKPGQRELELAAFAQIDATRPDGDRRIDYIVDNFLDGDRSMLDALQLPQADDILEDMDWISKEDMQFLRGEEIYSVSAKTLPGKKSRFTRKQKWRSEASSALWVTLLIAFFTLGIGSVLSRTGINFLEVVVVVFVVMILIGMMLPAVQQVREAARRTQIANSIRQLGLAMDNANSAGLPRAGDNTKSSPRVRKWFPETLFWRPQLITDDNGELELDVPLADSITTWKLNAQAVSAAGRLGGSESELRVFQPFFIDVNLPVTLTRHDEVSVPVIAYNYLDRPQKVKLTVREESWFELSGAAERTFTIDAGQQKVIHFPIRATKAGEHKLHITAIGDDGVSDAIEKDVSVKFEGQIVESVLNGNLQGRSSTTISVPDSAIEGSAKVILKAYPSRFSEVVEGLDGIFQRPHGCFEQTSSTTYPSVLALSYLQSTGQSLPEVETKALRYIQEGYQRLLTFEVRGGGFEWFGRSPANKALTAYGLMEFRDIDQVYPVDSDVIERTTEWLLSQRLADGSWGPDRRKFKSTGDKSRLATTAYIAWATFDKSTSTDSSPTKRWLLDHRPEEVQSTYTLALVCNALQKIASPEEAQPWIDELIGRAQTDAGQKLTWWDNGTEQTVFYGSGESGNIETTAVATLALIESRQAQNVQTRALHWLSSKRDSSGTWNTTQATVLTLKALLNGSGKASESTVDRQISVSRDGELVKRFVLKANKPVVQQFVIDEIDSGESFELNLEEVEASGVGFQITTRHNVLNEGPSAKESPIEIQLAYDAEKLSVNDELGVSASITSHLKEPAAMVMVTLPVPPGFVVDAAAFEKLVADRRIEKFEQTSQTVVLYLRGLEPDESIEFKYFLTATMPIKATAKRGLAWLYYSPEVRGMSDEVLLTVH